MSTASASSFALVLLPFLTVTSDEAPSVLRVYDISAAAPVVEHPTGAAIESVHGWGSDLGSASTTVRGREFCVEVLQSLAPDPWQVAEHEISIDQDGRLVVLAPPALQDGVAAALALFADTFGRESRLVIDTVTLKSSDAEALSAFVPVADLARLLAAGSEWQSHEITALPGERGWSRTLRTLDAVRGYEPMIAERAIAFQAVLDQTMAGLSIECALTPAPGGSWLALNVQDARPMGEVQDVDMRLESHITTDSSIVPVRGPGRIQTVRLDELVCALNTWLPDGKAIVVRTTSDASRGTTRVVFVHQTSALTGAITRLPESLKSMLGTRDGAVLRTDAYVLPRAKMYLSNEQRSLRSLANFAGQLSNEIYGTPMLEFGSPDEVVGRLQSQVDLSISSAGPWAVVIGADRASVDAQLARVSALLPEPRAIGVKLTVRRGSRTEDVLARAGFAIRTGARSTIVLGQESMAPHLTDGQVAQGAAVVFPRLSISFEGLAVGIEPRTTPAGDLLVMIDGHARASHGQAREFDSGTTSVPILHEQDADLLDVERSVTFKKSDTGPRRIVLGNAGSSAEALTLEVEVVDLR